MSGLSRPALRRGIARAAFTEGDVLHDSRSGRLFVLNPSASDALNAFRNGESEGDIIDRFVSRTALDPRAAREDLRRFTDALDQAGLLETGKPADMSGRALPPPRDRAAALDARYRLGDRTIRVVCHPAAVAAAFGQVAEPCRVADDEPAHTRLTLFRRGDVFHLLENDRIVDQLSSVRSARWALVREVVGEGRGRPWQALLHASAVLTPKGCLLLCGESGAGKSTLLAGLVHAGFPFVADDIVLMERATGLIWPTPMAISVKDSGWPVVGALFPELERAPVVRFGGRVMRYLHPGEARCAADAGHPLAGVLFVRHGHGEATALTPLDATRSLVLLGEGGSILPDTDAGLSAFLERWRRTPAWTLRYGRLDDAIGRLSSLTGRFDEDQAGAPAF